MKDNEENVSLGTHSKSGSGLPLEAQAEIERISFFLRNSSSSNLIYFLRMFNYHLPGTSDMGWLSRGSGGYL